MQVTSNPIDVVQCAEQPNNPLIGLNTEGDEKIN